VMLTFDNGAGEAGDVFSHTPQYCPTLICRFSINHFLNWTSLM